MASLASFHGSPGSLHLQFGYHWARLYLQLYFTVFTWSFQFVWCTAKWSSCYGRTAQSRNWRPLNAQCVKAKYPAFRLWLCCWHQKSCYFSEYEFQQLKLYVIKQQVSPLFRDFPYIILKLSVLFVMFYYIPSWISYNYVSSGNLQKKKKAE